MDLIPVKPISERTGDPDQSLDPINQRDPDHPTCTTVHGPGISSNSSDKFPSKTEPVQNIDGNMNKKHN